MSLTPQQPNPQTKLDPASVGLSGQFGHLVFVGVNKDGEELGTPGGVAGDYRVVLTLWKPRFSPRRGNAFGAEGDLQGDSYLEVAGSTPMQQASKDELLAAGKSIEYVAYMNDRNTVGKFVVERLRANSQIEAESMAYTGLAPFLSILATRFDLPLDVYQIDVTGGMNASVQNSLSFKNARPDRWSGLNA